MDKKKVVRNPKGKEPIYGKKKRAANITIAEQHEAVIKKAGRTEQLSTAIAYIAEQLIQHGTVILTSKNK